METKFIKQGISEKDQVLPSIELKHTYIEEIKTKQFQDEDLNKIRKKAVSDKAQDIVLDASEMLSFKERICVPRVDGII